MFVLKLSMLAHSLSCLSTFEHTFTCLTSSSAEMLGKNIQKHLAIRQKGCKVDSSARA